MPADHFLLPNLHREQHSPPGARYADVARVELDQVSKVYAGNVTAVDNITLHIADKEFIVLVGPSGCGKSTTLRMIAGLEEITAGTLRIGERVVNDVPPKDRDIAMVFQNYALYPHMTVYQNMAFGLKLRRVPREEIDRRVNEAANMLGLMPYLQRKPKALSGGQRQRVAVGRAIVRNPAAFLFDEPLSNLDAKLRVETRAELKKLHRRLQTTTIYVTHDQEEAMTLGDRIVVMYNGEIQQCDAPLSVYDRPLNRFVAGFVGTPPMNFLTGQLERDGGRLVFVESRENRIPLTPRQAALLETADRQELVLGIRPENFSDHAGPIASSGGVEATLAVQVNVKEPLGDKSDVYLSTSAHDKMICRINAHNSLVEGQPANVVFDMAKAHIFAPGDVGRNLTLEPASEMAHA